MNDLYRGYEIKPVTGGFMWTDEHGFDHYEGQSHEAPYKTDEKAMDGIDQYKRAVRNTTA